MQFRTIYSARQESRKNKKAIVFEEDSMTDQSYKDETNVNLILAKYRVTRDKGLLGLRPDGQPIKTPQYGDYGDVGSYQEALEVVMNAQDQFDALPAEVRKAVGNTPEGMLQFIQDPANYERGVELGIFEKRVDDVVIDNDSSNLGSINNGSSLPLDPNMEVTPNVE